MQLTINGKEEKLPDAVTVAGLLDVLKVRRDGMAVEVNREIVPRSLHAERILRDGDVIEIVTFVGGG